MRKQILLILAVVLVLPVSFSGSVETVRTYGMFEIPARGTVNGSIAVFSRPLDGQSDLWSVNLVTGDEKRLTESNVIESNPVFCGNNVVYTAAFDKTSQADLAMINLDGNVKMISQLPGDESRFWVFGERVIWVVEDGNVFTIKSYNSIDGETVQVRGQSKEKPTNILSNGKKVFWSQQDDSYDIDVWSYDFDTEKIDIICHEPGDQYCVGLEGNWLVVIGRYVFRPDRDLFVYDIENVMEIPVDTSTNDVTSAAISNSQVVYLSQPIDSTTDCQLRFARLGGTVVTNLPVERIWLTEKERVHFSWPVVMWEDKRDYYDKGIDIWAYNFNTDRSYPVSLDPGNQYIQAISGSTVTWLTTRNNLFGLSFKILSE